MMPWGIKVSSKRTDNQIWCTLSKYFSESLKDIALITIIQCFQAINSSNLSTKLNASSRHIKSDPQLVLPYIWVPLFQHPYSIATHALSIQKLCLNSAAEAEVRLHKYNIISLQQQCLTTLRQEMKKIQETARFETFL